VSGRLVLMAEGMKPDVANAITERLKASPMGFWHWMDNVWLITMTPAMTANEFYAWLKQIPGVSESRFLVLRVDSNSTEHQGLLPPDWWVWFQNNWK
jgi:hypothetical protein